MRDPELDPRGHLPDEYRARLVRDGLLTAEDVERVNAVIEVWGNEDATPGEPMSAAKADLVRRVETALEGRS